MGIKSFKEYATQLKEGFLDDDNEEALTADKLTDVKEEDKDKIKTPFPKNDEDDLTTSNELGDDDVDLSDELGTVDAEEDKTEKEDLADLKLDELSDDENVKDSGDEKTEEKEAEVERQEKATDAIDKLSDGISTLTTKLDALIDIVNNNSSEGSEGDASAESGDELGGGDDLNSDTGSDDLGGEGTGSDMGGSDDLGDLGDLGGGEGGEGTTEGNEGTEGGEGTSEEENANEGSDEDFGEDEVDNTKSEAYNFYARKGGLLNSNSGSLIGKAVNEKLFDFEETFMNIAKAKIRKLVEKKKQELRDNHFNY